MKAIEVTGTVNAKGHLSLDEPLAVENELLSNATQNRRVRVIVLFSEEVSEDDPDDEPTESVLEGIRQGWHEAMTGQTYPISELWERVDAE
jgi:hypothetical protein